MEGVDYSALSTTNEHHFLLSIRNYSHPLIEELLIFLFHLHSHACILSDVSPQITKPQKGTLNVGEASTNF